MIPIREIKEYPHNGRNFCNADDVALLLNVKRSKAYSLIRECNYELQEKGYITMRGRVPKNYLLSRLGMIDSEKGESESHEKQQ